MTRINLVDPSELMDQHLLAEYREIRLLCANLQRTLNSKSGFQEKKVPKQFTLNCGHVYFFYNKGRYIHERYEAIRDEMRKRGISADLDFPVEKWPKHLYNDWQPNEDDKNIVRERIALRISQRPNWYRYYGNRTDRQ
jgi:deoxyribonuclease (pyrimidine dimer)